MVTKFDIDKFDGKISFAIWKVHMQAVLTHHGYKKALRGIAHKLQSMSDEDWLELDEKALATIQLFLTREVLHEVIHETTTAGLWLKLESLYMTKSLANKLRLKDRLYTFRMKLDIDDEDKAVLLVISLPASYKHFKEIMLYGNHETLSFDDVKSALLSKQKYDDDVEPESSEGLVARGRSCKYCKKHGHIVSDCYKLKNKLEREGKGNNEKKPEKAAEVAIAKGDSDGDVYLAIETEKSRDELIVDSCCTFHMIPHRSWLTTYESFNGGNVYMGNHSICPIIRNGSIQVKMHDGVVRTITGVQHIPDLERNLISLSTLEANGCKYSGEGEVMKILKGALVLMKAIQSGGLYVLQGHMGEKGMKYLAKKGLIKVSCNLEFCEHYVFGKQKKHKDEVFLTFKEWKVLIESQTGKKIKKLRTDNGLEFCGESFNALCRKYGIARHHTLVRTPQQNGVAERMNRTIMEKVRCMLSHANLDKDFWVEAATTATYLINRSPHRSLDGNIPEILWSEGKVEFEFDTEYLLAWDRERRQVNRPPRLEDYQCDLVAYAFAAAAHIEGCEPTNYFEAISSPECDKWVVAMKEEVKDGIPRVESKWYKARYVVRGFDQREGIDFNEVFSLVVRHTSIRVLLSIVALQDLELEQLNVKTTFLHGHLEEEIYVKQPEDGSFLYLVLYVDDMLIAVRNKDQIRELKDQLSNEFDMKDLGAHEVGLARSQLEVCEPIGGTHDKTNTILIDLENLDVDIDNEDKAVLLVISLTSSYKHFKEIMLYGNRKTLSFDDVKSALLSKQKYDDDVEPESGEGLVASGQSSDRENGHIVSDCYKLKNKLEREGKGNNKKKPEKPAEVAITKGDFDGDIYLAIDIEKSKDELIVDSGCTFHMIPHRSWFTTYESFNGGNIYIGNHSICPVIGKGNIQVKMHNGVVRTIAGYSGEGGVMKIFKGALVLMKAIQSGGLYVLQGTVVYGTAGVATSKASLDDSKLWHYRLGHMGEKGMKYLAKKGLIKVSCIERGMLLTTFILIYGGHPLLRLEEHKDEVFPTFKEWKMLIENQTGKKIKKLRTDNERMNRTIMEKVRCMLSHANLDKDFWVEAATTASYLINCSPHISLDGNIPEILWSGNSVDYSNLRVFGCTVYVHVNEGKLVPRVVKCIFLGYGSGVKGYRVWCPNPKYRKIIHSRDVTFNEDVIINSGKDFVPLHMS
ncbi:retrovirus-related pol polyprotein from transposon TNT 1-94 [Tanacetum coccineum]